MNFLLNSIITTLKTNRIAQVCVILACISLVAGVPLYLQGSYYKASQKLKDAKLLKENAKLKLENEKLQRTSETLKDERDAMQAALDSKAKGADKRAQEIMLEAQEDRARIEAQYEKDKQQLEEISTQDPCTQCRYVCELYRRNNLRCPTDCNGECQ